jgi:ATP-dependent helicase/nuclease subunit A
MRAMAGVEAIQTPFGEGLRLGAPVLVAGEAQAPLSAASLPIWAKIPVEGPAPALMAAPSRLTQLNPTLFSPRGDGPGRFRRGRLIHGLLERLPEVAPAQRAQAAQTWLARQGAREAEAHAYAQEAMRIIDDARFGPLFGPLSRAEAPIVGTAAGRPVRGVVDRLAIDAARVLVLDYKTDRPAPREAAAAPAAYVTQLALYREVLRAVFPGKHVVCALLWTEQPLLMELAPTQLDDAFARFADG